MSEELRQDRWRRVKALFEAAVAHHADERSRFLAESGVDEAVKSEVAALLAAYDEGGHLFEWQDRGRPAMLGEAMNDLSELMPSFGPNTSLGHYRIEERIGIGGMGVVYKAVDTKLNRSVALKIVRPELLHDDGLKRLEREARALASLNHPHVAAIHGLEESADANFLVLEYVPGPTLAERLRRGALPVRDALGIARQIAEALEAAHARGIMHRDLKPANIKITDDGQVKVLDFGLAKSFDRPHGADSEAGLTISAMTKEMLIVGTAGYMSPEQACGKAVDTRTDIWAFGCILYEMLAGKAAFHGDTLGEIIAATVEREPDWPAVPPATPPAVIALLRRCLRKDPQNRLRDIGDARIELDEALGESTPSTVNRRGVDRRTMIGTMVGAATGAIVTGLAGISRYRNDGTRRTLTRFSIPLPEGEMLTASMNKRIAIAPDGSHVACNVVLTSGSSTNIFIRPVGQLAIRPLADGIRGVPFFSPDSKWVGYFATDAPWRLRKIPLAGGAPTTICSVESYAGGAWCVDDAIYFIATVPGGLMRVQAAGGDPREIVRPDLARGDRTYRNPAALPSGRALLVTVVTAENESFDDAEIRAVPLGGGPSKVLVAGGMAAGYSPSGHLVYARSGSLLAVRFDADLLEVRGQPMTVLDGVLMSRNSGVANFDISATGDLAYIPGNVVGGVRTLVWVDRQGRAEPLPLKPASYLHPRISPDGTRLAIEIEGSNHDVYVYDFRSGVLSNLTADGISHWPIWSPDGRRIGYRSGPMGQFQLWEVPADRSRAPTQVPAAGLSQTPESYSPDGRAIAYTTGAFAPGTPRVAVVSTDGTTKPQALDNTRYAQGSPKFSPDGRWIAYCAMESGRPQVFVQAFPGPGAKTQVSANGGTDPVWRRDGRELFYRADDAMMAVGVRTDPTFSATRPEELWRASYSQGMSSSCGAPGMTSSNYDVTPDGRRFLMIRDDDVAREVARQMVVVQGWADELTRLFSRT